MYKYDPCECCGHDINEADNPERIERMVQILCEEFNKSSADSHVWKVAKRLIEADVKDH